MASLTKVRMALLGVGWLLVATPASAQDTASGVVPGPAPIELSFGGAGVSTWVTTGGTFRVMVSMPINDRKSLEIFAGPYHGTAKDEFLGGVLAYYGFQTTRRIDRGLRAGFKAFVSLGVEGFVFQDQTYDCYGPGCRPHTRTLVMPPIVGMFGLGIQKTLSRHVALRIEGHGLAAFVIPLGVRAGVSLAIPLGQEYETRPKK